MYNPATKRVILTRGIKWHGFDGSNTANDPTLFEFTEDTGWKTTMTENETNRKKIIITYTYKKNNFHHQCIGITFMKLRMMIILVEIRNKPKHRMQP